MKFKLKLDARDLFRFSLVHTYTGMGGILSGLIAIISIVLIVQGIGFGRGLSSVAMGLMFLVIFFVLNPMMLLQKARKQASSNLLYQTETECVFDEEGMSVSVGEQEGKIAWDQIQRVQRAFGVYMLYTGPKTAFVFNEEKLGDEANDVMNFVYQHVGAHVKLPKGAVRK